MAASKAISQLSRGKWPFRIWAKTCDCRCVAEEDQRGDAEAPVIFVNDDNLGSFVPLGSFGGHSCGSRCGCGKPEERVRPRPTMLPPRTPPSHPGAPRPSMLPGRRRSRPSPDRGGSFASSPSPSPASSRSDGRESPAQLPVPDSSGPSTPFSRVTASEWLSPKARRAGDTTALGDAGGGGDLAAAPVDVWIPPGAATRSEVTGGLRLDGMINVASDDLDWATPSRSVCDSPGAMFMKHPPEWVRTAAAAAARRPSNSPSGSASVGLVQVLLDDGWHNCTPQQSKQIFANIAGGQSKFTVSTAREMYIIDMTGPSGPTRTNASTRKTRSMRIREPELDLGGEDEVFSPSSKPKEVAVQRRYGPQSRRGQASQLQMEVLQHNAHALDCFAEMARNEELHCGEWAVFYHSYSFAALIYEVHAAVAGVLFGYPSHRASLPRLLAGEFADTPSAPALLERYNTHFASQRRDHNPAYRKVAISAMCSLVALGPEASTPIIFTHGYSEKDVSFVGVLENMLAACLVPKGQVKRLAKSIVEISERHGLDVTQFGGKKCESGCPGHLLQIFIKRRLLDDLVYSAEPYGELDAERHPISTWLNGDNRTNYGQARIVAHPKFFLSEKCVKMFVASADVAFHRGRQRFQEELSVLLGGMWKDTAARERVAATIYGGMLPEWWRDEMVN